MSDKKALQRIVRGAERVIGISLPFCSRTLPKPLQEQGTEHHQGCLPPSQHSLWIAPIRKMVQSHKGWSKRLINSFLPQAVIDELSIWSMCWCKHLVIVLVLNYYIYCIFCCWSWRKVIIFHLLLCWYIKMTIKALIDWLTFQSSSLTSTVHVSARKYKI